LKGSNITGIIFTNLPDNGDIAMKNLSENSGFISGLYNYCDHWCERCTLTSCCRTFALSNDRLSDQNLRDISNDAFWQRLSEMLQETIDLLNLAAKQEGVDLESTDPGTASENTKITDEIIREHACCRMARIYADMVDDWFDLAEDIFEKDEDNAEFKPGFELLNPKPSNGAGLEDALQVIRWYQNQIYIKLMRAVRGSMQEKPKGPDDFARDSDGSAKVALIAIDRSIAAWGEARNYFPFYDDKIIEILLRLGQLRKKTEAAFPDARSFIRPGFDRIDLNG
jgi:hypothetical protein